MTVEIRAIKQEKSKAVYEILGEDHTLGNLLEKTLLSDERVTFASYENPHPLQNKIVLTVVVKEGFDPTEAIKDALKKIMAEAAAFREELIEALREHGREFEA